MDLQGIQQLSGPELAAALDELEISSGWAIGDEIRARVSFGEDVSLPEPAKGRNQAFQNLVVGTIAERVFRQQHLAKLEHTFTIADYHLAGENRDFGVQRDGLELPINVKVASTLFRNAKTVVGLDPEDCVPISAYKALGAADKAKEMVYVDLVDFELRARVDSFMDRLAGSLSVGWHLFSWFGGRGSKNAQDQYVAALFEAHLNDLIDLAPGTEAFHVISAQKVLAIMRREPRRVPGLGVKGAGTGGFIAEVNVHVSVEREMRPWADVAHDLEQRGIQYLLDQITRTVNVRIPAPLL